MNRRAGILALFACFVSVSAAEPDLIRHPTEAFLRLPPVLDGNEADIPALLSQTGAFADAATLRPSPGIVPYAVNQPLWSDGAAKQRWLAVPQAGAEPTDGERIVVDPDGPWTFPRGTMFIKHFAMPLDLRRPDGPARRLETRLLGVRGSGDVYGVTYRWRADGKDAELLPDEFTEDIPVIDEQGRPATITWIYPGRESCISCHTRESGGVLGVSTRQLNRAYHVHADQTGGTAHAAANQLVRLAAAGWFDRGIAAAAVAAMPRLRLITDASADIATRIRSYLDANCSSCHHPDSQVGSGAFAFDLRFGTPLAEQGLIGTEAANPLGIDGGRVLVPGDPSRSVLHNRVTRRDIYGMPPIGSTRVDPAFTALLEEWIADLQAQRP